MNADVCFLMGSTHKICQDYAISYPGQDSYIILSDGCSSAAHTDFGSRLLVKAAQACIYEYNKYCIDDAELIFSAILKLAHTYCRTLDLHDDSLAATLLMAKVESNKFRVFCVGDGVIAARKKTGEITAHEFEFESGAPYYLRYELDDRSKEGYFNTFGRICKEKIHTINSEVNTQEVESNFCFKKFWFELEFSLDEYESVAILSDGVSSFVQQVNTPTSRQNQLVPTTELLKEFLAFKGYNGEFVQRRCQRAFKQLKENHISNCDDFSLAVLTNHEQ